MTPKSVMIVEDEAITVRYVKGILKNMGIYTVASFDHAQALLDAVAKSQPDLIIMDINIMGSMDGIEAAHRIKMQYKIPIIFMTAYNDDETVAEVLSIAPYGFISKPFTEKELSITVKIAYQRYLADQAQTLTATDPYVTITPVCRYHTLENRLYLHEKPVKLTANQEKLLQTLIQNRNTLVSHEHLTFSIWEDEEIAASALRTLVYSLRKLLPDIPLETVSKNGYILRLQKH